MSSSVCANVQPVGKGWQSLSSNYARLPCEYEDLRTGYEGMLTVSSGGNQRYLLMLV